MEERISERALLLPALYIISRDCGASTSDLIRELTEVFNPSGEDAAILSSRRDSKFSQKVRNLIGSHRDTNGMAVYTIEHSYDRNRYVLTAEGQRLLDENYEQVEYLFLNQFHPTDATYVAEAINSTANRNEKLIVYTEKDMTSEGRRYFRNSIVRERSSILRNAAIEHYRRNDGKLYCEVCNTCFEDIYGEHGKDYIEIHHIRPIVQYPEEGFEALISEAISNVIPLCANCHRMIHRNPKYPLSIEELKGIYNNCNRW